MASPKDAPSSIVLDTGEPVGINEYVYVAGWGDGQPWAIARVMEFSLAREPEAGGSKSDNVEVKLAAFYRPQDITSRVNTEHRILFASLTSSVKPVSDIRGKCYVKHKDQIEDLSLWKQTPDHFFYKDLFDPFIKREFAMVAVSTLKNVPAKIHAVLMARYTFVITERDMVAELVGSYQTCDKCGDWASFATSVKCDTCAKSWHMDCLTPPLLSKPAKGYSWACAPCTRKHEKKVASSGPAPPPVGPARGKPVGRLGKARVNQFEMKFFRGWPFRYFGAYTFPEDTFDPDDPIFPRTASRVGPRFQTVVGTSTPDSYKEEGVPERGGPSTVTLLGQPMDGIDPYMRAVGKLDLPPPCKPFDLGVLSRAVELFCKPSISRAAGKAIDQMKRSTAQDFQAVQFAAFEIEALRHSADEKGGLEAHIASQETSRTPAECVRFYRVLREGDVRKRLEAIKLAASASFAKSRNPPPSPSQRDGHAHDDDMLFDPAVERGPKPVCNCCGTKASFRWWKIPKSHDSLGLWCEACGQHFFRYSNPPKQDVAKLALMAEKREGGPLHQPGKRIKTANGAVVVTPTTKLPPCACCGTLAAVKTIYRCSICSFSVHSSCYGIPLHTSTFGWKCSLCEDAEVRELSENPRCIFCPEGIDVAALPKGRLKVLDDPGPLYALKPTAGRNWAHVVCSTFVPGPTFGESSRLAPVENTHLVDPAAWTTPCSVCLRTAGGAVVKCADCSDHFHVACALLVGFKFSFEMTMVKSTRRDIITVARFKNESGQMHANIYCSKHKLGDRVLYEPSEIDAALELSALQVYSATYKQSTLAGNAVAVPRRAQVLDELLGLPDSSQVVVKATPPPECLSCKSTCSPRWYPEPHPSLFLCHLCHFDGQKLELEAATNGHHDPLVHAPCPPSPPTPSGPSPSSSGSISIKSDVMVLPFNDPLDSSTTRAIEDGRAEITAV